MNKTRKILLALHAGASTSKEISRVLRLERGSISVALCRLADRDMVERVGVVNAGRLGRPYVRWRPRVRKSATEPPCPRPE